MKLRSKILMVLVALFGVGLAAQAQVPGVNSTLQSVFTLAYEPSTSKPTYSGTAVFNPTATSATDICFLKGSATKTIRVRRIIFSGAANAVVTEPISVIKRSSDTNGSGTSIAVSTVPYDSGSAAATATMDIYTANITAGFQGTAVGTIAEQFYTWNNLTTGVGNQNLTFEFGRFGSPIFLKGASQTLSVSLNNASYTTPTVSCTFEWTEDSDS